MSLKWYLLLGLSSGFARKRLNFVGKHSGFYPKDVCSFSLFFYLNKEELTQQVCLKNYIKNEIFKSTLHKTKTEIKDEQKHNPTS